MWLRDFLPRDLPEAQVFTYGYPSKLMGSGSRARLIDYTLEFLSDLCRLNMRNPLAVHAQILDASEVMTEKADNVTLATTSYPNWTQLWWSHYKTGDQPSFQNHKRAFLDMNRQ